MKKIDDQRNAARSARHWLKIGILGAVYFGAAKFGLTLHAVAGFATVVWPPSGTALAALFIFGWRLWPGVFIGAFAINLLIGATPLLPQGLA